MEERTLYKEKVRVCTEEDTAKIVPGWLPDDVKDIASFSTKGRFRSRELKEGLVGNGNVLVYCDENKWRPAKVTGYNDADQAHKVEYTDSAKPHAEQMVYTKHVMFVLQPDGNGKREATLDLEEVRHPRCLPSPKAPPHSQELLLLLLLLLLLSLFSADVAVVDESGDDDDGAVGVAAAIWFTCSIPRVLPGYAVSVFTDLQCPK